MPSLSFQNLETTDVSNIIIVSRFSESQAAGMTDSVSRPPQRLEGTFCVLTSNDDSDFVFLSGFTF